VVVCPPISTLSLSPFPEFHSLYQLGDVLDQGEKDGWLSTRLATVKMPGPNKGLVVAVKCIDKTKVPVEEEEGLLEEVSIASKERETGTGRDR